MRRATRRVTRYKALCRAPGRAVGYPYPVRAMRLGRRLGPFDCGYNRAGWRLAGLYRGGTIYGIGDRRKSRGSEIREAHGF